MEFQIPPLWDISQSSAPDDDFLNFLQKQFPQNNYNSTGFVDLSESQNPYPLPTLTPPSEDSSPSPPNTNTDPNARSQYDDLADPALKRKASIDDLDEGPSQKSQHTSTKKGSASSARRKSSGGGGPDENRLLKRKEQNRAAQRAFRERKEKHVKDLEDKIAALEAKNDQATSENENLRDLLSRLQSENVALKQSPFTFTVPKTNPSDRESASVSSTAASPLFSSISRSTAASSPDSSRTSPAPAQALDWDSLTTFDPAILNLLDDSLQQPTATTGAMQMDFGFGNRNTANTPYTTIASNPSLMSFASAFDSASPITANNNDTAPFGFDLNSLSSWPTPSTSSQDMGSLDDLFGGYLGPTAPVDYNVLLASPASSLSPVSHPNTHSAANSASSSSPASIGSDPSLFNTPRDSSTSDSDLGHDTTKCPKTKAQLALVIEAQGPSPFAPPEPTPAVRKDAEGKSVTCHGSNFPKTVKSDQNVEVLSAWRSITSNPRFKDADINQLCDEFTNKARCDGTKVVLEPQGVNHILDKLSSNQ